jgi:acyl-CoA thioester hydrolase
MKKDREPQAQTPTAEITLHHRVQFFETDAMGIVHHANYVRYLEMARIEWMDLHDRPYREYVAMDRHFSTTRVEIDYRRAARFDDRLETRVWISWVRGASLGMSYEIQLSGETVAIAETRHAMVNREGRPVRIPKERRENLQSLLTAPPKNLD